MKMIYLSYPLARDTPVFGGKTNPVIEERSSMESGGFCNSLNLQINNHMGTHIDCPLHFVAGGKSVDQYSAEEFHFSKVALLEIPISAGRLLSPDDFPPNILSDDIELLLVRTGFGAMRGKDSYIKDGPGFDASTAQHIISNWPSLRAIGLDFISVTRYPAIEDGIAAHKVFLAHRDMLLIEDMDLGKLSANRVPDKVVVCPLRITGGDGAPATVVGYL